MSCAISGLASVGEEGLEQHPRAAWLETVQTVPTSVKPASRQGSLRFRWF